MTQQTDNLLERVAKMEEKVSILEQSYTEVKADIKDLLENLNMLKGGGRTFAIVGVLFSTALTILGILNYIK